MRIATEKDLRIATIEIGGNITTIIETDEEVVLESEIQGEDFGEVDPDHAE